MIRRTLFGLLAVILALQACAGCARYSTTRQVLPTRMIYYDPAATYDVRYVRTHRATLTCMNFFGFRMSTIDLNKYIKSILRENENYYAANLQVTHGCFNDYGLILTWIFTIPICKVQFDVMEVRQ